MGTGSLAGAYQGASPARPVPRQPDGHGGGQLWGPPAHARFPHGWGPLGRVRNTGGAVLFFCVTFGIYPFVYTYKTHQEMRLHSGDGIGGVIAVLIAFFAGIATPFLLSSEVGTLYERTGRPRPVSAATGLWSLTPYLMIFALLSPAFAGWQPTSAVVPLGALLLALVGPLTWFVKTNGALNNYWRTFGTL